MSQYTEQAEKFLTDNGLEFRVVLVGSDCPTFCADSEKDFEMDKVDVYPRKSHIHGKHYRCTLSKKGKGHVSFDFWNSYSDEEFNFVRANSHSVDEKTVSRVLGKGNNMTPLINRKRRTVSAYDLLACIQKNDPGTFEDFCSDFGYDNDSRKAEQVYHSVQAEWKKVQRLFTASEIKALQEILWLNYWSGYSNSKEMK